MTTEDHAKALVEVVRDLHQPSQLFLHRGEPDGSAAPVLVIPKGMQLSSAKGILDEYRATPERAKGTAKLETLDAFVAHVERFKDEGSAVFARVNAKAPELLAVYDYHQGPGRPRWGQHRASFAFPLAPEWQAWKALDGKELDQLTFAAFIEDHAHEVVPTSDEIAQAAAAKLANLDLRLATPGQVLTLSRGLTVRAESVIAETRKLATGETKILYDEKLSGEKGAPLDVPGAFVVGVPVFDGGDPYALPVRLRLRVASGKIAWTFALLGADDVVRDAVKGAVEKVRVVTGLTVFEGTPEA